MFHFFRPIKVQNTLIVGQKGPLQLQNRWNPSVEGYESGYEWRLRLYIPAPHSLQKKGPFGHRWNPSVHYRFRTSARQHLKEVLASHEAAQITCSPHPSPFLNWVIFSARLSPFLTPVSDPLENVHNAERRGRLSQLVLWGLSEHRVS